MGYVDLQTIHNPAVGTIPPAAWGDAIRDDLEFIIDPPRCSLRGLSTTTGNNAFTRLDAQVEEYDTDIMHAGTNDFMVVHTDGTYRIDAIVQFSSTVAGTGTGADGARLSEVYINSVTQYTIGQVGGASQFYDTVISGGTSLALNAGDSIAIRCRQTAGGNMEVQLKQFTARWIGR